MSEQTPDPASKVLARRRLLRGTFAAPVVLTMYSGGALAATSATCVAKAQASPQTGEVATGTTPTDTYLRVQLWISTTGNYWLRYEQIQIYPGAADIIANSNNYRRFDVGTNSLSTSMNPNEVNIANPPGNLSVSNKWAALRFDGTGTLVGVGATGGGSAITGSCWASVS